MAKNSRNDKANKSSQCSKLRSESGATSKSSKAWLKEHFSDTYVKRAQHEGLRARSVYKLSEINERYKIIKPGMVVVDLGAAPGSWSEYAAKIVGAKGKVIALDILPIVPLESVCRLNLNNVVYLQGDFRERAVVDELLHAITLGAGRAGISAATGTAAAVIAAASAAPAAAAAERQCLVHAVLSDMAPNTTGIKEVDQARSLELVYAAFHFAEQRLLPGGIFLTKVFQSQAVAELIKELRRAFREVKIVKPEASRSRSQEVFLLAQGFVLE